MKTIMFKAKSSSAAGLLRGGVQALNKKRRLNRWAYALFRALLLFSISYIILFPLFYMISNAFKPMEQLLDPSIAWIPKSLTLENFRLAAAAMDYGNSFLVSLRVGVVSALLQVFTCSYIAYGFARFRFRGRGLLFGLVILTVIVPPQAIIVPMYLNFTNVDFLGIIRGISSLTGTEIKINLIDTPFTFYIPSLLGVGLRSGLFIFIYRQFFQNLPRELEEAAWIDGAGPLRAYFSIAVPNSSIATLTVLIFSIVWHWNDIYLSSMFFVEEFPLSVSLSQIRKGLELTSGFAASADTATVRTILMAGCLLFIAPILLMYLFLQKRFIQSIETVGIVG
ncbi:MAG TPA: carbohydrate ABC transporter permease [Firmicutes bacterium]|nr:carbohydrate ABC transporter permease [Bacillota bacterium]